MAQPAEARALEAPATGSAGREPSMEEILASIKRIIEDSDGARRSGPVDETAAEPSLELPDPANDAELGGVTAFSSEIGKAATPAATEAFGPHAAPTVTPSLRSEPPAAPAPSRQAVPVIEPFRPAPAPSAELQPTRPSILSDRTGKQVASAFGELSDAYAASRRRSFDEIAEEMMRPMLQDWLDNNLPLLVEKLVREEIERVARGGAR